MDEYKVGEDILKYVELRDFLAAERKKYQELETNLKSELAFIEMRILEFQMRTGLTSTSTEGYTAYQTEKTFIRMGDWDKFSAWILETGNIQCVEKRPAKLACLELEEHGVSMLDIGLQKDTELCVQIRKK